MSRSCRLGKYGIEAFEYPMTEGILLEQEHDVIAHVDRENLTAMFTKPTAPGLILNRLATVVVDAQNGRKVHSSPESWHFESNLGIRGHHDVARGRCRPQLPP